jgi:hypothetical protein
VRAGKTRSRNDIAEPYIRDGASAVTTGIQHNRRLQAGITEYQEAVIEGERVSRRIMSIIFSVVAMSAIVTSSASAQTRVKCADASIAENCDGRDPVSQGCDINTQVVDRVKLFDKTGARVGALRLIFSSRCGTFWGRVTSDFGDAFDVSLTSVSNNQLKIFVTSRNRTGVPTTANSPMRFLPQSANAGVFLVVARTGETISRSTRSCPVPGSPNSCTPPPGVDD